MSDALERWAESAGLEEKAMEARQAVVNDAEGPMKLAESKAALNPYGTGGMGFPSSTSQLNLSTSCHRNSLKPTENTQRVPREVLTSSRKVDQCKAQIGGGRAAGCGDCVEERAEAARRAAGLVKTGEAARLAGDAIEKVGFAKHAAEAELREKAVSAEAFE